MNVGTENLKILDIKDTFQNLKSMENWKTSTLTYLIPGEALINGEGGKIAKINKQGG